MNKEGKVEEGRVSSLRYLNSKLLSTLGKLGYKKLTPIQEIAIPKVLTCRNVLVIAPTGSGKTEAALIPIISEIISNNYKPITVIYVTPLRALNRDILDRVARVCDSLGLRIDVRHGDTPQSRRRLIDENPPHILITTPETFSYILINRKLRNYLKNVRWVVIDELHEMLSNKRGVQLLLNIARLERITRRKLRKVALSANIANVEVIKKILDRFGDVCEAVINQVRDAKISVKASLTKHKYEVIADILRKYGRALIFTNTRDEAEWLGSKLISLGLNVRVHHGSLSKNVRVEAEEFFKKGKVNALIATSSLELGIDVGNVPLVIQSSSPRQASKLLQRVGRSMHKFNLAARGIIVTSNSVDDIVESIVIARRCTQGEVEDLNPPSKPLDVLAHTIVGMALESESRSTKLADVLKVIGKVVLYDGISTKELNELIQLLSELGYVKVIGDLILATEKGRLYYLKTTMIVDTSQYHVVDSLSNKVIGNLDEEFVATSIEVGNTIVLSGRLWNVLLIDDESRKVVVEPAEIGEALIPSWVGETIPVSYSVAREVCGLRRLIALNYLPETHKAFVGKDELEYVRKVIGEHRSRGYPLPYEKLVLIEIVRGRKPLLIIHTCLGSNGNKGLGMLLSMFLSKYLGVTLPLNTDPYRIIIQAPVNVNPESLKDFTSKAFNTLTKGDLINNLKTALESSKLFMYVLYKVLNRFGIINPGMPRNIINALLTRYSHNRVIREEAFNELLNKYIDVTALERFIRLLRDGKIKIKYTLSDDPSPLGSEAFTFKLHYYDRIKIEAIPPKVISEIVKRRLLSKETTMVCMMCGHTWRVKVSELPERIKCPKCGYGLVATSNNKNTEYLRDVVTKGLRAGKKYRFVLSSDERSVFEELLDRAKLVLIYGKRAVVALQGLGIGPKTAMRVLSECLDDDECLYTKIYEYERRYILTRRYWKS